MTRGPLLSSIELHLLMCMPRLLDWKAQETYHGKLVERYMKFCAQSGGGNKLEQQFSSLSLDSTGALNTTKSTSFDSFDASKGTDKELAILVGAMRKLRESIVASNRVDEFAVQVYFFCIRASILMKHVESYHPALLHLLRHLHSSRPLSRPELQEFGGYLILDLACRQQDLARAYAVRKAYQIHERRVNAVLSAMVHDNYYLFWEIKRNMDGYRAKIMEQAEHEMRIQSLKSLGRAYFSVERSFLTKVTGVEWRTLESEYGVGWDLEGDRVVIRKPKGR